MLVELLDSLLAEDVLDELSELRVLVLDDESELMLDAVLVLLLDTLDSVLVLLLLRDDRLDGLLDELLSSGALVSSSKMIEA